MSSCVRQQLLLERGKEKDMHLLSGNEAEFVAVK